MIRMLYRATLEAPVRTTMIRTFIDLKSLEAIEVEGMDGWRQATS